MEGGNETEQYTELTSVAEPHHFYAALVPDPGKTFDAAPAPTSFESSWNFGLLYNHVGPYEIVGIFQHLRIATRNQY
jgi:hypothetical protein